MDRYVINGAVVTSDKFISMSADAQCLYFHLCPSLNGIYVSNVKSTMRAINSSDYALKELIENGFLTLYDDNTYILKI